MLRVPPVLGSIPRPVMCVCVAMRCNRSVLRISWIRTELLTGAVAVAAAGAGADVDADVDDVVMLVL
jgi:hypothetical protein